MANFLGVKSLLKSDTLTEPEHTTLSSGLVLFLCLQLDPAFDPPFYQAPIGTPQLRTFLAIESQSPRRR